MLQRQIFLSILLASLGPTSLRAEIFKCVAPDGALTFSQTPCLLTDSEVTVQTSAMSRSSEARKCRYAHRFALLTAQEMKAGASSSAVFDRYGGLSALSRGSVSLISYVFQYRTNHSVVAERVAALSVAKCRAGSFGDVGCEQLPVAFTSRLGGCQQDDESGKLAALPFVNAALVPRRNAPEESKVKRQARYREARALEAERRKECTARIRSQIAKISSEMRAGYTNSRGNKLRNKRRDLESRLREC